MADSRIPSPVIEDERLHELRRSVRAFIDTELEAGGFSPQVDSWMTCWDREFSRKLAAQRWLGMTIPSEYGGHGQTFLERFVVTEELLAAGAPVTAHWFADRQVAPSLLKFGSETQKQKLLPRIAQGDVLFAIGMSEPDSGSDLASVRTRALRVDGGWSISGSKVWTSNAHVADFFIMLARSEPLDPDHRHAGLSQFIVDLKSDGVDVRPIISLNGEHHFNEVFLENVFVPDEWVLGEVGEGWHQVTSELAFERSGPERFLSTSALFEELREAMRSGDVPVDSGLGMYFARTMTLHSISLSVAGALTRSEPADFAASIVKDLGTTMEGDLTEHAALNLDPASARTARLGDLTDRALLSRPGFTLRGGTNEILRGVIARGLGLR